MPNSYAVLMPSLKVSGGNRVLLQFAREAVNDQKKCKLFYLDRQGEVFDDPFSNSFSQKVFGDGVFSIVFFSIILSFKVRLDNSVDSVIVSDPILLIFSIIYANKKITRFVQSNDYLLFDSNSKGGKILNLIYKYLFRVSQKYPYHSVVFNSKYSLNSYNESLKYKKYSEQNIVHPAVFTIGHKKDVIDYPNKDLIKVGIVTNNHPRKGYMEFLKIAEHSRLKGVCYNVISQDNLNSKLENVTFSRPDSDYEYIETLKKCHFFLSTSVFEGFGLPLIESMALGVVPIAYNNPGMDEYNTEKNISIIKDVDDFDNIIFKMINNPEEYLMISESVVKSSSVFTSKNFYLSFTKKIL
jgi:glycosyltransferase involved in cell wall biosynthesis